MAETSDFPCSKCGACCRRAGLLPDFPFQTDENGVCEHLTPENECEIYAERPDLCNIGTLYRQKYADLLTLAKYYYLNALLCNKFMDEDGTDPDLRIAIEEITNKE